MLVTKSSAMAASKEYQKEEMREKSVLSEGKYERNVDIERYANCFVVGKAIRAIKPVFT